MNTSTWLLAAALIWSYRLYLNDSVIRFPAACGGTKWRWIVFIRDQRRFASNEIGKPCHRSGRRSKPLRRETTIGNSFFAAPANDCDDRLDVNVGQCIARPCIRRRFLKRDNLGHPGIPRRALASNAGRLNLPTT